MATPDQAMETMLKNLQDKTGKSLAQWVEVVHGSGLGKHGAMVTWLKAEKGLTHGYANMVAHEALQSAATHSGAEDLVAGQCTGKEKLRPIYDRIASAVTAFGKDVELAPKKSYVSLRRGKQFGLVQPSTKTRVDVGIQLKGTAPTDRLGNSGSFNAMVSHRVRLSSAAEVDEQLIGWLREAYDAAE